MTRVDRFSGGLAGTTLLAAVGVLSGSPVLLVAAGIPVVFVAYGALTRVRGDPADLRVERSIERTSALPGERIGVELSVTNEGAGAADLRVADGVPAPVRVVDGHPRGAFALPRGESVTLRYVVVARRGVHEFGPARIRLRGASATGVRTADVAPEGPATLACTPDLESLPVRRGTRRYAGTVRTDSGGSGVEFHSTREYRRGDPVNRVDWRRLAKTGDLTTVDYREHRAARLVVLVDSRRRCHVEPAPGAPSGGAICAYGARRVVETLLADGDEVGAAVLGLVDATGTAALVPPGSGEEHRFRVAELLDAAAEPPDDVLGRVREAPFDGPSWPDGRPPDDPGGDGSGDPAGEEGPGRGVPGGESPGGGDGEGGHAAADGGSGGPAASGSVDEKGADTEIEEDADSGASAASGPGHEGGTDTGDEGEVDTGAEGEAHTGDEGEADTGDGEEVDTGDEEVTGSTGAAVSDPDGRAPAGGEDAVRQLSRRLPGTPGVVLFTPALDGYPETAVRVLAAHGHAVTVVSPDVADGTTPGARLLSAERDLHLESLRAAGARVVDWDRSRPLSVALAGALEGT